jgi:lipoprotein-anchoring transpeptidase ErfK/SrfK
VCERDHLVDELASRTPAERAKFPGIKPSRGDIILGGAIVVPPHGTPQRKFDKVLGKYRLNLGGGYGIHGTMYPDQLGRSVTHGCVRLGDADIEKLFAMANVGDQVLIY